MRVWSDARIHASVHDHTLLAQSVKVGWIWLWYRAALLRRCMSPKPDSDIELLSVSLCRLAGAGRISEGNANASIRFPPRWHTVASETSRMIRKVIKFNMDGHIVTEVVEVSNVGGRQAPTEQLKAFGK